jgi:small subunit ribosomal protein S1
MDDTEKPQAPAGAPSPTPVVPPEPERPSKIDLLRQAQLSQPKSRAPEPKPAPPPRLAPEQVYGGAAPRLKDLDAEIEGELAAALGGMSDKDLYGEPAKLGPKSAAGAEQPRKKGRIVSIHGPDVFLEVPGGRAPGVLPLQQFEEGPPQIGQEVEVSIEGYDNANGLLLLSRKGAAVQVDWSSVAVGLTVEARVTATNKGGLSVEVNGIRGFMPISQIDLYRVENTEPFVNQKLRCLVTEVNPAEHNLVVSRRAFLEKEREENRERLWQTLAEGQTYEGIVRSVRDFGAFVDLGGVDGLVHISDMAWTRVKHPSEVVQQGQKVKVIVLKIDREARKVGLGLKQLSAGPWDTADANYIPNSVVKGKVTRIMDFGAFVELEPGVEGLIHISELAPQRVRRVTDIVQPDQEVQVMILNVDKNQRRISLSLKAAQPKAVTEPEEEPEEDELPLKPPRPRTTPLRGGLGSE